MKPNEPCGPDLETLLETCWGSTLHDSRLWLEGDPDRTYKPAQPASGPAVRIDDPDAVGVTASADPEALPALEDYAPQEQIAEGGMGLIWRAHQRSLRRDVALKQIRRSLVGSVSVDYRGRFLAEALVTGYLEHPNIVPVHSLQNADGDTPVMAMKLIRGIGWNRLLHPVTREEHERARNADREEHLRILLDVCDAVAFAHSRGILHCDLKPDNVMLGDYGEVIVMDWGLAVHVGDPGPDGVRTADAGAMDCPAGTPAYMAPEQALADGPAVGPWTDVYLLGAILHEILAGHPPHRGVGLKEVLISAVRSAPPTFADDVPTELAGIARTALAAEPDCRYRSVQAFQQAIRTYQKNGESLVLSRRASTILDELSASTGADGPDLAEVYSRYADVVSRYRQALELWGGNRDALTGLREACMAFAELALRHGDERLARAQAAELDDDQEVIGLRKRIDAAIRADVRRTRTIRLLRAVLVGVVILTLTSVVYGAFLIGQVNDLAEQYKREASRVQAELTDQIHTLQREMQTLRASAGFEGEERSPQP